MLLQDANPTPSFGGFGLLDIEEASKSYALERYTASVFHLMRVAEAGLVSIAKRVGLQNTRPGWEEAITYIEGQVSKNYRDM